MSINARPNRVLISLLWVVVLVGCSGTSTLSEEEVRSEMKSDLSLAAETTLFIDYIRQSRPTRRYIEGEASYLRDEVNDSVKQFDKALPETRTENSINTCKAQLQLLDRELSNVPMETGNADALAAAKERISAIRNILEKASSAL